MVAFVALPGALPLRRARPLTLCSRPPSRTRIFSVATADSPADSSAASSQPSEFKSRFDDLRGKPVEPVSVAMGRFNTAFDRPVPIVYRGIINELLTTTHLATVCAMWRFDALFAYGFDQVFKEFLRYYPDADERDRLYRCCTDALNLDHALIVETAVSVADWLDGKTADDVLGAVSAASPGATAEAVGPVVEALAYIRDAGSFDWYYSRMFGIGLIRTMAVVGEELSVQKAEMWASKIGLEQGKFMAEMGAYLSSMERLKQAEQIFAEATAREAKKTAERLADRAKAAAKEAEELEKEDEEKETVKEGAGSESAAQDPAPSA